MRYKKLILVTAFSTLSAVQTAHAYDIQTKLDKAMVEYKQGNVGKSADILTDVSDYLRAQKAETLSKLLPPAPDGWVAEPSSNTGSSLMGGSSQSRASYTKGSEKVVVTYMTDNKLVASMLSLLSQTSANNPDGLKMHNGFVSTFDKAQDNNQYVFNLYVSEYLVVAVRGDTLTEETAIQFVDKIDMSKLKQEASK